MALSQSVAANCRSRKSNLFFFFVYIEGDIFYFPVHRRKCGRRSTTASYTNMSMQQVKHILFLLLQLVYVIKHVYLLLHNYYVIKHIFFSYFSSNIYSYT